MIFGHDEGKNLVKLHNTGVIKLWENASPKSAFDPQNIPVENIRDYELFIVVCRMAAQNARKVVGICRLQPDAQTGNNGEVQYIGNLESTNNNMFIFRRFLFNVNNYIGVEACSYKQNTTTTENNSYLVPEAIYGIKGVQ